MNVMSKITLYNLRRNKKRTVVTVIGVILSAAMITAVATLCESFVNTMLTESRAAVRILGGGAEGRGVWARRELRGAL